MTGHLLCTMLAKRFWLNHAKDMVQRDWKNDECLAFRSWKNLTLLLRRGRPRNIKTWFRAIFFHHWISCFELSHQCFRRSCLWIWWTWRHRYSLSFAVLFWTVSLKAIFDSILSYGKNKKFASYPPIIFSFPPWLLHGHLWELYTKRDRRYSVSVSLLKLHLVLNQNWTNVWRKLVRKICTWAEINLRFQLWRTRVADPDSWYMFLSLRSRHPTGWNAIAELRCS